FVSFYHGGESPTGGTVRANAGLRPAGIPTGYENCLSMKVLRRSSINRSSCGDWPDLLDAVAAHTDKPVVEVDGRVAMTGDQPDLVAEPEPVGGGRNGEPPVLV